MTSQNSRPQSLQDDLLADLRQTAPMPDPRPGAERRAARRPVADATPAVELRLTRTPWRSPSMRLVSRGLTLSAGPVSVSLGLSRR